MKNKNTIMIVEDEETLLEAYDFICHSMGYRTLLARNGRQALNLLESYSPDIMLLDIYMPKLRGDEMLQELKREDFPNMKIIAFTNIESSFLKEQILKDGADLLVAKSELSPKKLLELLKHFEKNKTAAV